MGKSEKTVNLIIEAAFSKENTKKI